MRKFVYRVSWESKVTYAKGHGGWQKSYKIVKSWVVAKNKEHSDTSHFVENMELVR